MSFGSIYKSRISALPLFVWKLLMPTFSTGQTYHHSRCHIFHHECKCRKSFFDVIGWTMALRHLFFGGGGYNLSAGTDEELVNLQTRAFSPGVFCCRKSR